MEKAKISAYQLFVLIMLFELGSAILVPLGLDAKRDAWLAILFGMTGGIGLFWIHYRLYRFYPDLTPTEYMQKLVGRFFGKIIAFGYVLFFVYLAARVLRDFGEMLVTFAYIETPLFVINTLLILAVVYTMQKGIEVIARSGELFFIVMYILAVVGFILIVSTGLINLQELRPVLEAGWGRVIKTVAKEVLYVPFGEIAVFAVLLPYLTDSKKVKIAGVVGILLSGINLALVMAINLSVLGLNLTSRSQFPLLSTIQSIELAEFIERLDVFFMIVVVIGIFMKICLFFYGAVSHTAILFRIETPSSLAYPLGMVLLFLSITISSSYSEHLMEGLHVTTKFLHPTFLVAIPLLLLGIAYFKNRKKS